MAKLIVIECGRSPRPAQVAEPQAAEAASKKAPAQENQFLRPRVLRRWRLRQTIWQIAEREHRRPSEIERILWEEIVPYLPPAIVRRAA